MSILDWLILALVGALLVLAFRAARNKKGCACGSGCSGNCAACGMSCGRKTEKESAKR